MKTSIIIHETYFQDIRHPLSLIKGLFQKKLIKDLVKKSDFTFSSSPYLLDDINEWNLGAKTYYLPIGSNIPLIKINKVNKRKEKKIKKNEIVLTIFGGGNAVKENRKLVNNIDKFLAFKNIKVTWLFLGNLNTEWFNLSGNIIYPGQISRKSISEWLNISDIFILPHSSGLCAKRGALMAAIQHSLPVVGIRSMQTEKFWEDAKGINLISNNYTKEFLNKVYMLAIDQNLRINQGKQNYEYFQKNFTWPIIAKRFLNLIDI